MSSDEIVVAYDDQRVAFPKHEIPTYARETFKEIYLLRDEEGVPCEEPEAAFVRVAGFIGAEGRLSLEEINGLIQLMRAGVFYPNVVFFMNAGTPVRNYGACYALKLEDSTEKIAEAFSLAMAIQTQGGGLGIDFTPLRPADSLVSSNRGKASGPVNFMRLFDSLTGVIKSGGRRRGANIGVLSCDHRDIEKFVQCKQTPGEFENFNLSVRVTDDFMHAVVNESGPSRNLFRLICQCAWKTGDPGLLFHEALQRDNPCPDFGLVTTSNPCGEVTLPSPFACNLASIDVSKFARDSAFSWEEFSVAIRLGCRFLEAALDAGIYVGEECRKRMKEIRPIGLGIMGFGDMLLKLKVRYGSEESVNWAHRLAEGMAMRACDAVPKCGARLAFAPTGSLAALARCSSGIEPNFAWKTTRTIRTTGEKVEVIHPLYRDWFGCQTHPDYFVTAHEVTPEEHVRVAAAFQEHVDGGISKTVNLQSSATVDDVAAVFQLAWELGCKGITVYRDGCRADQPIQSKVVERVESAAAPRRERLPDTRSSVTHKFRVGDMEGYATVGKYPDGRSGEVFLELATAGSAANGLAKAFAIAISFGLQYGIPLEAFVRKFEHMRFDPSGTTSNKDIPFAKSVIAYLFKWLAKEFEVAGIKEGTVGGDLCPVCHSSLRHFSGCSECSNCAWNNCG